jgi:hypothetical protein
VEIIPAAAFPPATPFTLQATPVFVLPATAAVYCDEVPRVTLVAPLRVKVTGPSVVVFGGTASATGRLFDTVGAATLVAVIVMFGDCGALAGATYRPFAEIEPAAALPPATPFTLQVTVLSELPLTVAAYCDLPPSITVLGPVSVIDTGASPPAKRDASLTTSPQAVRRSTKSVLKIAQVRVRQMERILSVLRPL